EMAGLRSTVEESLRLLSEQLRQLLDQLHLQQPLQARDSLSIRTDRERRLVEGLLARYRALPEEQRRSAGLLNGLGKLQVAADDLDRQAEMVLQEATVLEQLNHPGIIRLRHCGYADAARSRPYLVMDYFEGEMLEEHVRRAGPLPPADVLPVARAVAEALQG